MGTLGGVSLSDLGFGNAPTNSNGTYNLLGDGGLAEQLDNIGAANGVGTVQQLNDEYELAQQQANYNAQIAPLQAELAAEQSASTSSSTNSSTSSPTLVDTGGVSASSPTLLDTTSTFQTPTTTDTSSSSSASSDLMTAISNLMSLVLGSSK